MGFNTKHLPTLKAILRAFFVESRIDIDSAVQDVIEIIENLPKAEQADFNQLFWLLDSRINFFVGGSFKPFSEQSLKEQQSLLQNWANSSIGDLRKAFLSIKKLACFVQYAYATESQANPNWERMAYPGPLGGGTKDPNPLKIIEVNKDCELSCDAVIVGSGAGGSVVAAELAKKGLSVIVVDKGPYLQSHEYNQLEADMVSQLFDRKGALVSHDGAITVFAGSCVGGGTTVNWSGSLRTPDYVLNEWAEEHLNPQFKDPAYKKCFEHIEKRCSISTDFGKHSSQNEKLLQAAKSKNLYVNEIPFNALPAKNELEWKGYNFGSMGDRYRNKQSAQNTFLLDACKDGARILPNTLVDKVEIGEGKAKGILAVYDKKYQVKIKSRIVIAACGAVQTPALLFRSGLRHSHIGKHLYLHPVVPTQGVYDEAIEPWYGPMMTTSVDEFTQLDGNHGFKIECPPVHAGLMAMASPWKNAQQFETDMAKAANTAIFFPLVRDKFSGQVWLSKDKRPEIRYHLHKYDKAHLIRGLQECAKLHYEAGANEIQVAHTNTSIFKKGDDLTGFLSQIADLKWDKNRFILFTAHQMGTCRMGGDDKRHPLKPNGETREVKNLFVADASSFPNCSGVNPMLSIQALAYYISQHIH